MRGKFFVRLAVMAGLILFAACEVSAHGTGYKHSVFRAVSLEFMYSTGELMSYREARVFSPNDEKYSYQSGRTDEKGRFAFVPDVPGKWSVIVRDEEGHQCTAEIIITSDDLTTTQKQASQDEGTILQGWELFMRAALGVSLIFNIALLIRRKHAH